MKNRRIVVLVIMVMLTVGYPAVTFAQPLGITVELDLPKTSFGPGEPVPVTVSLTNKIPDTVWISEGFGSLEYLLELRVIDPFGRLLLPRRSDDVSEMPYDAPLAYVRTETGNMVRVAGCEEFSEGEYIQSSPDLRQHYDMGVPGWYSAQVQLSVMVFKGPVCNVDDYAWKGVLKSATKYFVIEGSTEGTKVAPDRWSTKWLDENTNAPDVQVHIWPNKGESTADYDHNNIRLNGILAVRVMALKPMIKAYFNTGEVIRQLGSIEIGESYWVYVTGKYKNGTSFGRVQQIRIVN